MSSQPSQNSNATGRGLHGGRGGVGRGQVIRFTRRSAADDSERGRVIRGEIGQAGRAGHPRGGDGGEGSGPVVSISMEEIGRGARVSGGTGGSGGAGVRESSASVAGPARGSGNNLEDSELSVAEWCRKLGVSEEILKELDGRGITTVGELRKLSRSELEKYGLSSRDFVM